MASSNPTTCPISPSFSPCKAGTAAGRRHGSAALAGALEIAESASFLGAYAYAREIGTPESPVIAESVP